MRGIQSKWTGYLVAVAASAVGLGLRLLLIPFWKDRLVFLTFYGAVILTVWYSGLGPGLLALGLCAAAVAYFWVDLSPADVGDQIGLLGFVLVSLLTVSIISALQRARQRIESNAVALRANAAALKESERHFRAITEVISDFAYICGMEPDGTAVTEWISQAFTRATGYNLGDLNTRSWSTRVHPEDIEIVRQHMARVMAGEPDVCEFRILTRRGESLWLRNNIRPVWDPAKERVVRFYGAAKDITERRVGQALAEAPGGAAGDSG